MKNFETRYLESCGIEYRHRPGTGPNVIMLHGIGSDASSFDRVLVHLPVDWNVVAWNAPGYGASDPLADCEPDADDYAQKLEGFANALGIGSMIIVGHSLGTLMAAAFVDNIPKRVTGLVLIACAQGYGIKKGTVLPKKATDRLNALDRLGPQAFAAERAPRLMAHPDRQPEVLADAMAAMSRVDPAGYRQAVYALSRGDLAGKLEQISVPSLVLVGGQDVITPPDQSRKAHDTLLACAPGLAHQWIEIENAGHVVHQQRPAAVATALCEFVDELQPAKESVCP